MGSNPGSPKLCNARHVCKPWPHDGRWPSRTVRRVKLCRQHSCGSNYNSACRSSDQSEEKLIQEELQEEGLLQEEVKGLLLRRERSIKTSMMEVTPKSSRSEGLRS